MAETVMAEDPLFGWIAYGGTLSETRKGFAVAPSDGIRGRFSVVTDDLRASLVLERDGFAGDEAVELSRSADRINFRMENRSGDSHLTQLKVQGFGVSAEVSAGGKRLEAEQSNTFETRFMVPVSGKYVDVEVVLRSRK
jgi:hypothetical protein